MVLVCKQAACDSCPAATAAVTAGRVGQACTSAGGTRLKRCWRQFRPRVPRRTAAGSPLAGWAPQCAFTSDSQLSTYLAAPYPPCFACQVAGWLLSASLFPSSPSLSWLLLLCATQVVRVELEWRGLTYQVHVGRRRKHSWMAVLHSSSGLVPAGRLLAILGG